MTEHHRRGKARAKRLAMREGGAGAGPSEAIWPGVSGGNYRPFTASEVDRIHATVIQILETVGLQNATERCINTVLRGGGRLSDGGRLLMPAKLVEEMLHVAGREFNLYALNSDYDIDPSATRIHLGTSGAAVSVVDSKTFCQLTAVRSAAAR